MSVSGEPVSFNFGPEDECTYTFMSFSELTEVGELSFDGNILFSDDIEMFRLERDGKIFETFDFYFIKEGSDERYDL